MQHIKDKYRIGTDEYITIEHDCRFAKEYFKSLKFRYLELLAKQTFLGSVASPGSTASDIPAGYKETLSKTKRDVADLDGVVRSLSAELCEKTGEYASLERKLDADRQTLCEIEQEEDALGKEVQTVDYYEKIFARVKECEAKNMQLMDQIEDTKQKIESFDIQSIRAEIADLEKSREAFAKKTENKTHVAQWAEISAWYRAANELFCELFSIASLSEDTENELLDITANGVRAVFAFRRGILVAIDTAGNEVLAEHAILTGTPLVFVAGCEAQTLETNPKNQPSRDY